MPEQCPSCEQYINEITALKAELNQERQLRKLAEDHIAILEQLAEVRIKLLHQVYNHFINGITTGEGG